MPAETKSSYLSERQHRDAWAAARLASDRGQQFDAAITIHWALAGGPGDGNWATRQKHLRDLLRLWIERRGGRGTWACLWVNEAAPGSKDVHSHAAVHLPAGIEFHELETYLRGQLNAPNDANVLKVDPCKNHEHGWPGWMRYITKAVHPALFDKLEVPPYRSFRQPQGPIHGKRLILSRSIGPAARRLATLKRLRKAPSASRVHSPIAGVIAPAASPGDR